MSNDRPPGASGVTASAQDPAVAAADRLDHQTSLDYLRDLIKLRFQLLGLLPAVYGAILTALTVVGLQPIAVVGPALLGLIITVAFTLHEIRNSQIHDNTIHRLRHLERLLGLDPSVPGPRPGGLFGERTRRQLFLRGGVGPIVTQWTARGGVAAACRMLLEAHNETGPHLSARHIVGGMDVG